MLIAIKLVLDEKVINAVSTYAPQVSLAAKIKQQFWKEMDELMWSILEGQMVLVGSNLNRNIQKSNIGYERVDDGFDFMDRNLMGDSILELAIAYNLAIANFKKRGEHFITFKSGSNLLQTLLKL